MSASSHGHGRLMKEWVVVGAGKANWGVELAQEAYHFVKQNKGK